MKTQKSLKIFAFVAVLFSMIFLSYYTVGGLDSVSPPWMASPYPGAPAYTIFREGNLYFAKNSYGRLDFSGRDASQIINNAINRINGGVIYVRNGTYVLTSSIIVKSDIVIEGEGFLTIFQLGNDANVDVISNAAEAPSQSIVLRNFKVDGNKANQKPATNADIFGIILFNASRTLIDHVWVTSTYAGGIFLTTTNIHGPIPDDYFESNSVIQNSIVEDIGIPFDIGKGIGIASQSNVVIANNIVMNTESQGIWGYGSYNVTVTGNIVKRSTVGAGGGIWASYESHHWTISNNIVAEHTQDAILINSGRDHTIVGNVVCGNFGSAIVILDGSVSVVGNLIESNLAHGIRILPIVKNVSNVVIKGNTIKNNGGSGIIVESSPTYQASNIVISGNTIIDNQPSSTQDYGIQICGQLNKDFIIDNNVIAGNDGHGLYLMAPEATISGNIIKNNDRGNHDMDGIRVYTGVTDVIITGNRLYDDQTQKTQYVGINLENGTDYIIVLGNDARGNADSSILTGDGTHNVIDNNIT